MRNQIKRLTCKIQIKFFNKRRFGKMTKIFKIEKNNMNIKKIKKGA